MRTVDTSAWIEWFVKSPVGDRLLPLWPAMDRCIVPTIVQFELMKWISRELSDDIANDVLAHTQRCVVMDLDTSIAAHAAVISRSHGLATADAIVYATALSCEAPLLTCDADFAGLPGVDYVDKRAK